MFICRWFVFVFPGGGLFDDGQVGKNGPKTPSAVAIYVPGGTGGAVFVRKKGSITVEAACVMAVVLFSLAALIGNAGRIHDETVSAMVLHESVEKCRHEKGISVRDVELFFKEHKGLRLRFTGTGISIQEKGEKRTGKTAEGSWEKQIEMTAFRPEAFLRKITLITGGDR